MSPVPPVPVPARWRDEIAEVLVSEPQLAARVAELGAALTADLAGRDLVVVGLLNGTALFLADLVRRLDLHLELDFLGVSSYGHGTTAGALTFTKELRLPVRGRTVLLVDDILDTGRTFQAVLHRLHALGPREIKTCVLLDKPARRVVPVTADYIGFQIPDHFVIGYGLDYAERYRQLPFVGILHPAVCPPGPAPAP